MSEFKSVEQMSVFEAKQEIGNIMADPKSPYVDNLHPNHQLYVDRMEQLHRHVYPDPDAGETPEQRVMNEMVRKTGVTMKDIEEADEEALGMEGEAVRKKAEDELRLHFGAEYEESVGLAQRTLRTFANEQQTQRLVDLGLANDPEFVKAIHAVGRMIAEREQKQR